VNNLLQAMAFFFDEKGMDKFLHFFSFNYISSILHISSLFSNLARTINRYFSLFCRPQIPGLIFRAPSGHT